MWALDPLTLVGVTPFKLAEKLDSKLTYLLCSRRRNLNLGNGNVVIGLHQSLCERSVDCLSQISLKFGPENSENSVKNCIQIFFVLIDEFGLFSDRQILTLFYDN